MSCRGEIALVGDYSPDVIAHRAIPRALELVRDETGIAITWRWVHTREIRDASDLATFAALWLVPASPYANTTGALEAIRWARESRRPFLGTCGGFQHALVEFARNVAGLPTADHAETNPDGRTLLIAPLTCSLVERTGLVHFAPESHLANAYRSSTAREDYHCSYGLNSAYREALESAGLRLTAWDETGDVRAAELSRTQHPFFVGTLFQPERAALRGEIPPLVRAFLRSVSDR